MCVVISGHTVYSCRAVKLTTILYNYSINHKILYIYVYSFDADVSIHRYITIYQCDLNVYQYMPKCIGIWRYIDQYIVAFLVYVELI